MNGVAERLGQMLVARASTMRVDENLDFKWWPELAATANYPRNREPVIGINMSPYEAHLGR
jgi:hypothetical protein